ncbi:hypothetical protein HD554DRAFT_2041530 [Boletus coccyginus]|nr:hypothetical protein HD554DRAFT_2041530 [Boletus coccyginus]
MKCQHHYFGRLGGDGVSESKEMVSSGVDIIEVVVQAVPIVTGGPESAGDFHNERPHWLILITGAIVSIIPRQDHIIGLRQNPGILVTVVRTMAQRAMYRWRWIRRGRVRACGFEPAKALVRGLPLPLPLSFRDRLGYQLPILSPIEGVGQTTKWPATAGARPWIDWLRCGQNEWGGGRLPARPSLYTGWARGQARPAKPTGRSGAEAPFGDPQHTFSLPCGPHSGTFHYEARKTVAEEVVSCATKDALEDTGKLYFDHYIRSSAERQDVKIAPTRPFSCETACRRSTVMQCTHIFDASTNEKPAGQGNDKRHHAASVWAIMDRFGYKDTAENRNGKVGILLFYVKRIQQFQDELHFTTEDPENLLLPSPEYLGNAVCVKIAHMSGAGEYIDQILRELEDTTAVVQIPLYGIVVTLRFGWEWVARVPFMFPVILLDVYVEDLFSHCAFFPRCFYLDLSNDEITRCSFQFGLGTFVQSHTSQSSSPSSNGTPRIWPRDFYTCEVAAIFEAVAGQHGNTRKFFQEMYGINVTFHASTFSEHLKRWNNASPSARAQFIDAGQTEDG